MSAPTLTPSPPELDAVPGVTQHLALDDLRRATFAPTISPLPSAVALIADAISDDRRSPASLRRAILGRLRRQDLATLSPFRTGTWPGELTEVAHGFTFEQELEAIVATDPNELSSGIASGLRTGRPAGPWRVLQHEPAGWLRSYVTALRRAWSAVAPLWKRSEALLDREVERLSVALARGVGDTVIPLLNPNSAVADGHWWLRSHTDRAGRLGVADRVQLRPLIAPNAGKGWTDDGADLLIGVRYALPSLWRAFDGEQPPPASLDALVGPQRARILHSLDTPKTAGRLAEVLYAVPSAATHHTQALEAAGLVSRTPDGRHIVVTRTARGTNLLALYERS